MSALGEYRAALAAQIVPPPGVLVTLDPAAGPPMILVDGADIDAASGIGAWAARVPIKCVSAGPGDATDLEQIETMLEAVFAALGAMPAAKGTYRPTVDLSFPMYELTYPAQIPNPNC